jgi:hypothetical protein
VETVSTLSQPDIRTMTKRRNIPKITGTVDVKEVSNSTVAGVLVQYGPDRKQLREELRQAVSEGLKGLLLLDRNQLKNLNNADPVAASLYACESDRGSALGFAVNNSGLIICPAVLGPIKQVRQLTSGEITPSERLSTFSMLQAVQIRSTTHGLIPSYRYYPEFDERLYAFNERGGHCKLKVASVCLTAKIGEGEGE